MIVYEGTGQEKDTVVSEDIAFSYMLERIRSADKTEKEDLVEYWMSTHGYLRREEP